MAQREPFQTGYKPLQDGWCEVLGASARCCETNVEMKNYICGGFDKSSAVNTIERRIGFDRTSGMLRQCATVCLLVRKGNVINREQIINRKNVLW